MVQQQIHRELADMLLHDSVLQQAIVPESGLGADMYLSSMATISDVEISKDLQVFPFASFFDVFEAWVYKVRAIELTGTKLPWQRTVLLAIGEV